MWGDKNAPKTAPLGSADGDEDIGGAIFPFRAILGLFRRPFFAFSVLD